jgi:fermentation-respiration switch protein FrsA (DUF1100 family)
MEDLPDVHPLAEVGRYAGPALVVHGECDEAVPPGDATDYHRALGGRGQLHVVAGADHVFSTLVWQSEAIALSRDFLLKTLTHC